MRAAGPIILATLLAGCAAQPAPDAAEAARAGEARACAAAVAEHVGKTEDAVTATWDHATARGTTVFVVTDAEASGSDRVHTCEVDAAGRVLAILHPGA